MNTLRDSYVIKCVPEKHAIMFTTGAYTHLAFRQLFLKPQN